MTTNKDSLREAIEQKFLNRVKFIGDDSWELLGTPNDVIKELVEALTSHIEEAERKAKFKYEPD